MSSRRKRVGRVSLASVLALAIVALTVTVAVASHRFTDVSDDNAFHDDITWLADNGVTFGCNPPANTQFCPSDNVTREQMAAFMRRLSEDQVVDAATAQVAESVADGAITGPKLGETTVVREVSDPWAWDETDIRVASVACPEGSSLLTGGASIERPSDGALRSGNGPVLRGSRPSGNGWFAYAMKSEAHLNEGYGDDHLIVYAVCLMG